MSGKHKYTKLCEKEKSLPVFNKYYWLDAVWGEDNWDVINVIKNDEIIAALPYCATKDRMGKQKIVMPPLTPHCGLWIKYPEPQSRVKRASFEKKVICDVVDQLSQLNLSRFSLNFEPTFTNWLPFHWAGFKQTTRYTYRLQDTSNLDNIVKFFESSKRREIKKAKRTCSIRYGMDDNQFVTHLKETLSKGNQHLYYGSALLRRILKTVHDQKCGKTIYCQDNDGNIHGALLIVWDGKYVYNLISSFDPAYRGNGSPSLLVSEAIRFASNNNLLFDFEGSMVETYERSYRGFGGIQTPYFNISKTFASELIIMEGVKRATYGLKLFIKRKLLKMS